MEPVSDIQRKIYEFIVHTIETERLPPTNREIGRALGLSSTSHVEHHLKVLAKKQWIVRMPGKGRGIKLIQRRGIPLKGTIAAGRPLDIYPGTPDLLEMGEHFFAQRSDVYALLVQGESMIEDHICDGDYVVIQSETSYQNGDIVVATHLQGSEGGSATLKRVFQEVDGMRLQPANSELEPILIPKSVWDREWEVQGKVVAIFRQCGTAA